MRRWFIYTYKEPSTFVIAISSKLGKVGWSFRGLHGMFSFMYKIKPPPNRLRSRLKALKPKIWNWVVGNVLSSFDSEIRNKSKAFTMLSAKVNLFLIELIFKWPTIMLLALSTLGCWIWASYHHWCYIRSNWPSELAITWYMRNDY